MTILSGDIVLNKADTMDDSNSGGGSITSAVVIDGQSNNIVDDITSLDRIVGRVHIRKVFPHIVTENSDKFMGSRTIISKLPGDTRLGVSIFSTGDSFDRLPSAKSRIENYRAGGPNYQGFLWGTQYKDSRAVAIFQSETAPIPGVGDVLLLLSGQTSQFIRITRVTDSVQTFTTEGLAFKRRIINLQLSEPLLYDFVGTEISQSDNLNPASKVYTTVVANAAKYYSASRLATSAAANQNKVKVDSVYTSIVPSSQAETAMVDVTGGSKAASPIVSSQGTVSFSVSGAFDPGATMYLGNPFVPGSLSIPVSGGTLVDSGGRLMRGSTELGTVSYSAGTFTLSSSAPSFTGTKIVTFRPAGSPARLADTASSSVTSTNRGYIWTLTLQPPPKPGSLVVSYRALKNWYDLNDNGNGALIGASAGIGSGTINYVTGTATITTTALPDADSDILYAWNTGSNYVNRSDLSPSPYLIRVQLTQTGIVPGSLTISWNDGTARTATANTSGVLSGYATGTINHSTGEVKFTPTTLPLTGQQFTFGYQKGDPKSKTFNSPTRDGSGNLVLNLNDTNILPNTVQVSWNVDIDPVSYSSTIKFNNSSFHLQAI